MAILQSQPQGCALTITGALGPMIHQTAQTQKAPRGELVSERALLLVAGAHTRRSLSGLITSVCNQSSRKVVTAPWPRMSNAFWAPLNRF